MGRYRGTPYFTVVIPTRDRPELFLRTLKSVIKQSFTQFEIIVVNDGSNNVNSDRYNELLIDKYENLALIDLVHTPQGHGPSYSRNFGARAGIGHYVCFIDDDDEWVDPGYLQRVYNEIESNSVVVDAYYSHQKAYLPSGEHKSETIWIEDLILHSDTVVTPEAKEVSVDFLLQSTGFAHMNCSIYRQAFFSTEVGGMNENIRYESDRDLYYRAIDKAECILFSPCFIAKHYIPEKKNRDNVTTKLQVLDKLLFQIQSYNRFVLFAKNQQIVERARIAKIHALKKMTEELYAQKEYSKALNFGKEALSSKLTVKWLIFLVLVKIKQLTSG